MSKLDILKHIEIVIEFQSDDDTKPSERMVMYLPGNTRLTVKGLLALSQAEARDYDIIGKADWVARFKYSDSTQHPGGLNISLSTPVRNMTKMAMVNPTETAGGDVLHLSAVVSRAHTGGPEMRLPSLNTEGLSKQEVIGAEDNLVPVTSGSAHQGSGNDVILLASDGVGAQGRQDEPWSAADEENAMGSRSSPNGGTAVGSPLAPHQTPAASSSSLSQSVWERTRRTVRVAASITGKRKQPADEEGISPSSAGRQHLSRAAKRKVQMASIDLPVKKRLQRQQKDTTRDTDKAKKGCECGRSGQPSYGLPGAQGMDTTGITRRWCSQCPSKPKNAVNMKYKRCECGSKIPCFGVPGSSGMAAAQWCSQCPSKPKNAVNIVHKRCECGRHRAIFALAGGTGEKVARWCSKCPSKPDKAVDARSKRCECGHCQPSFGPPGAISGPKAARWCSQCPSKPNNAVAVLHKLCKCGSSRPTFGPPGSSGWKAAQWCSQCPSKPKNAVNLKYKRCECGSNIPSFGVPGSSGWKAAQWCPQCPSKPKNAANVVRKRCECGRKIPSFGVPGTTAPKAARWCSQCPSKPKNAVNVKHKRCECGIHQPSFGPPGTTAPKAARWCSQCPSKPNNAVDVRHKLCKCGSSRPTFGPPGSISQWNAAQWCSQCPSKPKNAVSVRLKL